MIRSVTIVLFIFIVLTSCSGAADKFPSWIPEDAVQAAKDHWNHMAGVQKGDWLIRSHGVIYDEALEIVLRHPRIIVGVDYGGFAADKSILEHFYDYGGKYSDTFGFSVCLDDTRLGSVEVYLDGDLWRMRQITGQGDQEIYLDFKSFYAKYPPSGDLIIYQKFDGALFAVREGEVVDVLVLNVETRAYECMDPLTHMIVEKNKIIEWKNSEMYKYHENEMKKQKGN